MIFKIYDYDNNPKLIDLPISEDEISCIEITVLSGDEIVEVTAENGDSFTFDSSESRVIDFLTENILLIILKQFLLGFIGNQQKKK